MKEKGYEVVVYDNLSSGHQAAIGDTELVVADLAEADKLKAALKGVDAVVHFAAHIYVDESVSDPAKYYRNNFINSLTLLEAMKETGVKKIVFSSTAAVYGDAKDLPVKEDAQLNPINPYGQSKLMFEQAMEWCCPAYEIQGISLRYFNASGAHKSAELGDAHLIQGHLGTSCIKAAMGQLPLLKIFGTDWNTVDGTCVRDYIHVSDLARAHIAALENIDKGEPRHRVYNLGTGKGVSVKEVIAATKKVSGVDFKVEEVGRRAGDPEELRAGVEKAKQELGFEATESDIENIIQTAWNWHTKHPKGFE